MTDELEPQDRQPRALAVVLVAVLAIVLALTGGLALLTGGGPVPTGPTAPLGPTAPPTQPGPAGPDGFPPNESNLRVISVGDALEWAGSGQADGRAMAVGGWWVKDLAWSCPWTGRDRLPIEGYCTVDYLSSAPYERYTCSNNSDGSGECHGNPVPSGVQVMPAMMLPETAGADSLGRVPDAQSKHGIPVVLILHVGDLRSLECPIGSRETCANKALVDRVDWVAGEDVEGGARIDLVTALTPDEAIFASRFEVDVALLTVFPVRLGESWTIDPRFHGVGNDPVWVIRAIPLVPSGVPENPSRAVDVRLVDDATRNVLFSGALGPGPDYTPARLLVQATEPTDAAGDVGMYFRVESSEASPTRVVEDSLGSTMPTAGDTTRNLAAVPTLLDAGAYVVSVWKTPESGDGSKHFDECTMPVTLAPSGELLLEAAFPRQGACEFVPPTFVNPFNQ